MGETKRRNKAAWRAHLIAHMGRRLDDCTDEETVSVARYHGSAIEHRTGLPGGEYLRSAQEEREQVCAGLSVMCREEMVSRHRGWLEAAREYREWSAEMYGPLLGTLGVDNG